MIGQIILATLYVFLAYMACRFLFPAMIAAHFTRIVRDKLGRVE